MRYLPILLIILFTSCQNQENQNATKNYYDLAGFINIQIKKLTDNQPLIAKSVLIEGKSENLNNNKIDWQKELELFLQADLNKQAYQNSYNEVKTDSSVVYQLKADEKLPVKSLEIYFDKSHSPHFIKAELSTKNYLYESHKSLKMSLLDNQLQNYQIKGYQELFIGDKKDFEISGILKK
jgi:hypothetical protein